MNKRICEVRKSVSLSMRSFGEKIGISGQSVARLESGENNPSEQTIRAICSEFSINRDWLEFGVGEMSVQKPLIPELIHNLRNYPKSLQALSSLTPEEWQVFENMLARREK